MKSIINFLKKCFGHINIKLSLKFINHIFVKCAKSRSYIEYAEKAGFKVIDKREVYSDHDKLVVIRFKK